jgi:hypothetical protein
MHTNSIKTKSPLNKVSDFLSNKLEYITIAAPVILVCLGITAWVALWVHLGIFPFGPQQDLQAKVQRLYVDVSGSKDSTSSHYMVGTDKGVFEVSNSLWLWIWDADKRYSQLQTDKEYKLQVKGNEVVNFLFQEYPVITSVSSPSTNSTKE